MQQNLSVEIRNNNDKHYNIEISDEEICETVNKIKALTKDKKHLFVFSAKVYKLYKDFFNFEENEYIILKDGEKEKTLKNYAKILQKATEIGLTRKDTMISVGGGVIGDITSFAASTYMRGIDYIQVPTTLLAMVDSSVGGKTAIDFCNAKNIIGTFWQPKAVFININFIKTLDNKQFRSGLGEIIKYAFIEGNCGYNSEFHMFEYLMLCAEKLLGKESRTLMRVIECCLNLKIAIVTKDEKETGLRKILNFGHTLAHALEVRTKCRKFTHGQAVIYGIYFILDWAYAQGKIGYSYHKLSLDLFEKYSFKNIHLKKFGTPEEFVKIMKLDKKVTDDKITFIVPKAKKFVQEIQLTESEVLKMF